MELAVHYQQRGGNPQADDQEILNFLKDYGHRGSTEMDIGTPRWIEDPQYILDVLNSYLQSDPVQMLTDFQEKKKQAEALIEDLQERITQVKGKRKAPRKQCELGGGTDVRVALIDGATFYAKPVKYTVVDGIAIMEGDIELGPVEKVERITEMHRMEQRGEVAFGVVITGADNHWPNCVIPYTVDDALPVSSVQG